MFHFLPKPDFLSDLNPYFLQVPLVALYVFYFPPLFPYYFSLFPINKGIRAVCAIFYATKGTLGK